MHSSTSNSIDIVDHLVEANITPRAAGKQYVAIYIRYDDNDLKTSFQYQKEHYQAFLNKHAIWLLIPPSQVVSHYSKLWWPSLAIFGSR